MHSTCPNPGCGAQYNLGPEYLGRQFVCRKCGTTLVVDSDGLRPATAAPAAPAPVVHAMPAAQAPSAPRASAMGGQMLGQVKSDLFTWIFGTGAILVILFTFFPVLDRVHADRLVAKADVQRRAYERKADNKPLTQAQNDELKKLREEAEDYGNDARLNHWRDTWGILSGFLLLAVASIGWLQPEQAKQKRITATIVLSGELLLVFLFYVAAGKLGA